MSAAYNEDALKRELRALTAAARQLREELEAELTAPKLTLQPPSSSRPEPPHDGPEHLRAKARDVRARAARKLMKSRATRARTERLLNRRAANET